jgi:ribosomal protein S30
MRKRRSRKVEVWNSTPATPAAREAETGRIKNQGHLGQKVSKTPSQSISPAQWCVPATLVTQEGRTGRSITV